MRIDPERWPESLKRVCRERCAEIGEPACFDVDLWVNPRDPDCGTVCAECQRESAEGLQQIEENDDG